MTRIATVAVLALSGCLLDARETVFEDPTKGPPPMGGTESPCWVDCAAGGGDGFDDFFDDGPVIEPSLPPPAISGGTMAVMSDGRIVVADSDRDLIYVASVPGPQVATIPLLRGDEPGRVVEGAPGFAFVALRRAGQVATIDLESKAVVGRRAVCAAPRGLAWRASTGVLYVACATGELREVDEAAGTVRTVWQGQDLRDVVVLERGLLVSTFRHAQLWSVGFDGATQVQVPLPRIAEFDPTVAWRLAPMGTGAVMVHQQALAPDAPQENAYGSSNPHLIGMSIEQILVDPQTGHIEVKQLVGLLRDAVLPVDIAALTPDAYTVVLAGQNDLLTTRAFGLVPGQPVAVAYRGGSQIIFTREPAQLIIDGEKFSLNQRPVLSTGHDLFHTATRNGVACASCHAEGGDDGHVWPVVGGKLRTPTLRGGLSSSAPFHWSGDLATMKALVTEVMVRRMGGDSQSDARIAALERWIDAQPALPPRPGLDPAAVSRGAALFSSPQVGCAVCHSSRTGTNNSTVDVGTGGQFQVPRLTEVGYRGALMHDGRAAGLRERFYPQLGGGDSHGRTSQLTQAELGDLISYLEAR